MNASLPVFVESISGGYRATTVGPGDLTAEGGTADAAVSALKVKVDAKIQAGASVVNLRLDDAEFNAILDRMASNPLSEQFHQDILDARAAADAADSDHPL